MTFTACTSQVVNCYDLKQDRRCKATRLDVASFARITQKRCRSETRLAGKPHQLDAREWTQMRTIPDLQILRFANSNLKYWSHCFHFLRPSHLFPHGNQDYKTHLIGVPDGRGGGSKRGWAPQPLELGGGGAPLPLRLLTVRKKIMPKLLGFSLFRYKLERETGKTVQFYLRRAFQPFHF